MMNDLMGQLGELYEYVHSQRQPLTTLSRHLQSRYLRLLRKVNKVRNMERLLDAMRIWNQSNISKVLSISPQRISQEGDIRGVMGQFEEVTRLMG